MLNDVWTYKKSIILISLIPKIKNPMMMAHFWPISLCNVLYKIISKVLADRFQKVMNSIIGEAQSAFLPGRLITDNVIIEFEVFHQVNGNNSKVSPHMPLKLDMSKAFGQVECCFLEILM